VLVACALVGVDCREYSPSTVKQAVCGYGRARKDQVQRMVQTILGLRAVPTPHDAPDAVAVCDALSPPLIRAGS
jgi:crossover junction endodeoxyribonuclease RuvC